MGNGAVTSRCVKVSLLTDSVILFSSCLFFSLALSLSFLLLFLLLLVAVREGISKEASFPTKHFNQSDTELKSKGIGW